MGGKIMQAPLLSAAERASNLISVLSVCTHSEEGETERRGEEGADIADTQVAFCFKATCQLPTAKR